MLVAAGQRGADGDVLRSGDGVVEGDVVIAAGGFGDDFGRQVAHMDGRCVGGDDEPLDDVAELADVPRPRVVAEDAHALDLAVVPQRGLFDEVLDEVAACSLRRSRSGARGAGRR